MNACYTFIFQGWKRLKYMGKILNRSWIIVEMSVSLNNTKIDMSKTKKGWVREEGRGNTCGCGK